MNTIYTFLFLIIIVFCNSFSSMTEKEYTKRVNPLNQQIFIILASLGQLIVFLVLNNFSFHLDSSYVLYSLAFSLCNAGTLFCMLKSFSCGPYSISNLFLAFSLIMGILYGIIFLNEQFTFFLILGFIFLSISIFCVNYTKNNETKISAKWLIYIVLTFLFNGSGGIIMKMYAVKIENAFSNDMMILALIFVISLMALMLIFKKEKNLRASFRNSGLCIITGLFIGFSNFLLMIVNKTVPVSFSSPFISASMVIVSFAIGSIFYHEKFTRLQIFGVLSGVISVILLNLQG